MARGDTPGLEFDSWGWLFKDNVWMREDGASIDRLLLTIWSGCDPDGAAGGPFQPAGWQADFDSDGDVDLKNVAVFTEVFADGT